MSNHELTQASNNNALASQDRTLDQTFSEEKLDLLSAQPINIESIPRDEMLQSLLDLSRTNQSSGAAFDDVGFACFFIDFSDGLASANRTPRREGKRH